MTGMSMLSFLLTVPASTANTLAYAMLVVVAIFLVSGPALVYYFWKQDKKLRNAAPSSS
jgi:hypothetical protein